MPIKSVSIQNFKSIREARVELSQINVLIGPNGGGKSNFISFFKFLNKLYEQQLQLYISQNGRADNFLYFGRKPSEFLGGAIAFSLSEEISSDEATKAEYNFELVPDQSSNLIFEIDKGYLYYPDSSDNKIGLGNYGRGGFESHLLTSEDGNSTFAVNLMLKSSLTIWDKNLTSRQLLPGQ